MTSFAFASFASTTLGAAIVTVANQIDEHTVYVQVTSPGFIATIIIGLLAGWIAGHITRGRGFGCIVDVILGLIGAVIGRWLFMKLGIAVAPCFSWPSLASSRAAGIELPLHTCHSVLPSMHFCSRGTAGRARMTRRYALPINQECRPHSKER